MNLLKKAGKTWDDVIEPRANFSEVDKNAIEAFKTGATKSKRLPFIENENDIKRILDNLLLKENGNLKRSAVLLFGKNPERFYINAYVKIGKFGTSDTDLKYQEIIEVIYINWLIKYWKFWTVNLSFPLFHMKVYDELKTGSIHMKQSGRQL